MLNIQKRLIAGEQIHPVSLKEIIFRRATGEISSEKMMDRLRAYTFGRVMYDFYDSGTWDQVRHERSRKFLTEEDLRNCRRSPSGSGCTHRQRRDERLRPTTASAPGTFREQLQDATRGTLADGQPFNLAALVHQQSSDTADLIREELWRCRQT